MNARGALYLKDRVSSDIKKEDVTLGRGSRGNDGRP